MAIENFEEVQQYIAENMDKDENIKNYVGGLNPITSDRVEEFLKSDDGKKLLQPKLDSYHAKSLESWKQNNISKLVDAEIEKRFPTADPKDVALEKFKAEKDAELSKINAELERMKSESLKKELTNHALKVAQEKKLPTDLIDYFIGNDQDTTDKNLEKFMKIMSAHDEAIKTEFAKSNSYVPPDSKQEPVNEAEKVRAEVAKWLK